MADQTQIMAQVVQCLCDTPESLNPGVRLYYELWVQYSFNGLDVAALALNRDQLALQIEAGTAESKEVIAILNRLRDSRSRSSRHALPL